MASCWWPTATRGQFLAWYAMDVAVHGDHVVVTAATTGELRVLARTVLEGG